MNLSGEPKANRINCRAEADKLNPSKTPTISSMIMPVLAQFMRLLASVSRLCASVCVCLASVCVCVRLCASACECSRLCASVCVCSRLSRVCVHLLASVCVCSRLCASAHVKGSECSRLFACSHLFESFESFKSFKSFECGGLAHFIRLLTNARVGRLILRMLASVCVCVRLSRVCVRLCASARVCVRLCASLCVCLASVSRMCASACGNWLILCVSRHSKSSKVGGTGSFHSNAQVLLSYNSTVILSPCCIL